MNTLEDREPRYGDFASRSELAQHIKSAFRMSPGWHRLAPYQRQALDEIAGKISRILNGDPKYDDSWHDIAGYAKLVEDQLGKELVFTKLLTSEPSLAGRGQKKAGPQKS
jgi:hypothetical protein